MGDGPVCIYLDTNVWIGLARGVEAGSGPWYEAGADLLVLRNEGRVVLPLSSVHYRELWHRGDVDSRERVGAIMRDLSGYSTLGAIDVVRRMEIDAYIEHWFHDTNEPVARRHVLGHGVNHAFASKYGRLRFVESLESDDVPEGPPTDAPAHWDDAKAAGPGWEWFNLVGVDRFLNRSGLDRTPAHRDGTHWVEQELAFRSQLESIPAMKDRLWDIIVVQEIQGLSDEINEACVAANVNPYGLFLAPPATHPPSAMRALIEGLPTVHVFGMLRLHKHRDLTHPWEQHDLSDLISLATAVPYCNAVVTEKRWAHLVRASGLARTYDTVLGSGLPGLRAALALVAP